VNGLVRAAGGLVLRRGAAGLEVLLVHRPAYDDWSLPKGKLEPGEPEREAALREVEEETGLRCLLGREVGTTEYVDSSGRPKHVRYWTMAVPDGEPEPANEVDEVAWASPAEAAARIDYAHDRELLDTLAQSAGLETELVYLGRHAKAGSREKWDEPDELRPLTASGRRQAESLAAVFVDEPIAALVSSPYARCVETLEPLGAVLGLPVQEHDVLAEGGSAVSALRLVRAVAVLGPVVLSTHGDVQEFAVHALVAEGVPLDGPLRFAKGSIWVLTVSRGEIVGGRYVPPLA
jgi:8-oxo-dGTP pyrophosphatase MutT (NUDIX family)/phosphohistidine phosphatase SixA